jgi:hypothetical protein
MRGKKRLLDKAMEKYKCIFEQSDLSVECLFSGKLEKSPMKKIVKDLGVKINTIDEFLDKLEGKKITDLDKDFEKWCNNEDNKNCYKFVEMVGDRFASLYENGYHKALPTYCNINFLAKCPVKFDGRKEFCYEESKDEKSNEIYFDLRVNEEGKCGYPSTCSSRCNDCLCYSDIACREIFTTLYATLWGSCCDSEKKLNKIGIKIDKACEYIYNSVEGCFKAITSGQDMISDYSKLMEKFLTSINFCEEKINIKGEAEKYILTKTAFGQWYLDTLKSQIKNVKKFYETKDKCSQQ